MTYGEYVNELIRDGHIDEVTLEPIKCFCGCTELVQGDIYYAEFGRVEEYSLVCTSCNTKLGTWAYGSWHV